MSMVNEITDSLKPLTLDRGLGYSLFATIAAVTHQELDIASLSYNTKTTIVASCIILAAHSTPLWLANLPSPYTFERAHLEINSILHIDGCNRDLRVRPSGAHYPKLSLTIVKPRSTTGTQPNISLALDLSSDAALRS